jgi:hypothetical protein
MEVLPVPAVALRVTHGGAEAVHAQPTPLVTTLATALPPDAGNKMVGLLTLNVHEPLPATVTGITAPAMVTVPLSVPLVVFVAATAPIVAEPIDPPCVNVSQGSVEIADQAQALLLAVTGTEIVPPWLG